MRKYSKNKIILFDLDGTIIDSFHSIFDSFNFSLSKNGFKKINQEEIKPLIGLPLTDMFKAVTNLNNASLVETLVNSYREQYSKIYLDKTILLDGAGEAIEMASKIAILGIVTSKKRFFTEKILKHFDIYKYFSVVVGIDDVQYPKPNEEPILKALDLILFKNAFNILDSKIYLNESLQNYKEGTFVNKNFIKITKLLQIYMIGDTIFDIESALNSKITPCAVRCGYGSDISLENALGTAFKRNIFNNVLNAICYIKKL